MLDAGGLGYSGDNTKPPKETPMKKTLLIAGAAVLAIGVPALAAHHEGPKGDHPMMQDMTRADAEAKVKERFAMVDADKDGAITMDEIKAHREAKRAARRDMHFKKMDANGDGSISREEFDTAHAMKHDKMADGKMKRHKMGHHGMGKMMGGRMFEMADANKDGKVTLAEATTAALTHFDKVDADKNGTVTPAERMDYWKTKKMEWKSKAQKAS